MAFLQGLFGPPDVEKLKAKRDINGLIKALAYKKDPGGLIPWNAAKALGEIGDARAVEPLMKALRNKDISSAAADALGQIKNARAVELLVAALNDGDTSVRWYAARILVQIGDVQAVEPLVAMLMNENEDYEVRGKAAEALGQIGDVQAVEPLVAALESGWVTVHEGTVKALGRIGVPAVDALVAVLKGEDKDWMMRAHAAEALGQIGSSRAVAPLMATLKDQSRKVRIAAAEALKSLGWQPIDDIHRALYAIACEEWDNVAKIGAAAVEPLVATLKVNQYVVRTAAAEVLKSLGWQPTDDIPRALYAIACKEWDNVARIGAAAVEPLVAAFKDESGPFHEEVAKALGKIRDPRAVEPLLATLRLHGIQMKLAGYTFRDDYALLRQAAVEALENIRDVRAVELLETALNDEDEYVREAVVKALEQIRQR